MPLMLFNKPFRVLSQFTGGTDKQTLANFIAMPGMYPAGRLDYDSEGLLLLTDDGRLQARISQPRSKMVKTYWAQVEGIPDDRQLLLLETGIKLGDGPARALRAQRLNEPPALWPRDPPVRFRKNVPDAWLEIRLCEGRNRQVRRMTAAVGLPTLRLVRRAIGPWTFEGLAPGESRTLDNRNAWRQLLL